jgi:hypothetical protein
MFLPENVVDLSKKKKIFCCLMGRNSFKEDLYILFLNNLGDNIQVFSIILM